MNTDKIVKSSELRQGDVVLCHGMRCLIDGEIRQYERAGDLPVYQARALVLNRAEVSNAQVPFGFTQTNWKPEAEHRWTIQGNDLARWYVEA